MPWNDQSGGPQGGSPGGQGGGKGPWGSGPRQPWGTPPRPPQQPERDLEDMLRGWRDRFRFGGGGGGGSGGGRSPLSFPLVAGIVAAGWLLTGTYLVNEGEQAVITRFGAYNRTTGPGAHWHLPAPIEAARVVNVTGVRSNEIGCDRSTNNCIDPDEGLMLTGDRNIVDVHFRVYYNIADVGAFVFNVRDPVDDDRDNNQGAVRQVVESAMREVIGRRELEPIITTDRGAVEQEVQALAQQVLNDYRAGVRITQVQLLNATVPPEVFAAFNDVISANQDAETAVNNANRDSARIVNEAEAYKGQVIRQATGDAEAFNAVYTEYRAAPQVTRDRIYTETMERVYQRGNLVILDSRGGNVTYLPLDGMIRRNAGAAQPQVEGTR
ncbi:FtsH protease activity modulator HflK [Terricaulis sp.]|uniref:FtsH protease activity modulator HflK n=1 Tax=Terricaulis sp. TaxID=2768686 RepID=UPI0037835006